MILFVCTGNICRSAMGEILFRHHSKNADLNIETASCGVLAWDGSPITADALKVLEASGVKDLEHTSTAITENLVSRADLVVAMTRDHAGGVISKHPPARDYTFLPGEILRHMKNYPLKAAENSRVGNSKVENRELGLQDWVKDLNQIRNEAFSPSSGSKGTVLGIAGDEIADPAIGSHEDHAKVFKTINELTELLAKNLGRRI